MAFAAFSQSGTVPAKKNSRRAYGGRVSTDPEVTRRLMDITFLLRAAHRGSPPIDQAEADFKFYVSNGACDSDNSVTSLLDCLQDAGIIVNDNVKHFRRHTVEGFLVPKGEERFQVVVRGR